MIGNTQAADTCSPGDDVAARVGHEEDARQGQRAREDGGRLPAAVAQASNSTGAVRSVACSR